MLDNKKIIERVIIGFVFFSLIVSATVNIIVVDNNVELNSKYVEQEQNLNKHVHLNHKLIKTINVLEDKFLNIEDEIIYTKFHKEVSAHYDKLKYIKDRKRSIKNNIYFINYLSDSPLNIKYVEQIAIAFFDAGEKFNIDSKDLIATAWHENRFNHKRRSKAGARGLMQIMTLWLRHEDFKKESNINTAHDLDDPVKSIYAGAYIFRHYMDFWQKKGAKDSKKLALLSYNRGSGTVTRLIKRGKDPSNGYAVVVQSKSNKLSNIEAEIL